MNKREKLQLSNDVICWLSKEVTRARYIVNRLKETSHIEGYMVDNYSIDNLDYLEEKIKELECRAAFESRNIRKIRYED